jgi:hypothetical protein
MKRKSVKSINPCESLQPCRQAGVIQTYDVKAHGGEFTCDTTIGKVSIFTITLPKSN